MQNENLKISARKQEWKYPRNLLILSLVLISICAFFICFLDENAPNCYKNLFWLPLIHALILIVSYSGLLKGGFYADLPVLIILITLTMRNAVTPLVMATETYVSKLGIPISQQEVNTAIGLFIYESIAVVITMFVCLHNRISAKKRLTVKLGIKSNLLFQSILLAGIVVSVVSFVVLPELRTQYYTIFTSDITGIASEEMEYATGIKRALATACNLIIEATRLTLSTAAICWLRKRGENIVNYTLSILVILLHFFFMNDSNAYIIMLMFSLYILIYKLYPRYGKATIKYLVIIGVAFCVLMYVNRFSQDMYSESLSLFLQAYFPGISNFTGIFRLAEPDFSEAFNQLMIDLYAAVPFRSTLFGYDGGQVSLPDLWQEANNVKGHIIPNLAQSYYYFGLVLSPVLPVFMTAWAFRAFKKSKTTKNPYLFSFYTYMTIHTCIALFMYNFYIFTRTLLQGMLFMYLFACFSTDKFEDIPGLSAATHELQGNAITDHKGENP